MSSRRFRFRVRFASKTIGGGARGSWGRGAHVHSAALPCEALPSPSRAVGARRGAGARALARTGEAVGRKVRGTRSPSTAPTWAPRWAARRGSFDMDTGVTSVAPEPTASRSLRCRGRMRAHRFCTRCCTRSVRAGPLWAKFRVDFCQAWADFGQPPSDFSQAWPTPAKVGPISTTFDLVSQRLGPKFGRVGPSLVRILAKVGPTSENLGVSAKFVRLSSTLG